MDEVKSEIPSLLSKLWYIIFPPKPDLRFEEREFHHWFDDKDDRSGISISMFIVNRGKKPTTIRKISIIRMSPDHLDKLFDIRTNPFEVGVGKDKKYSTNYMFLGSFLKYDKIEFDLKFEHTEGWNVIHVKSELLDKYKEIRVKSKLALERNEKISNYLINLISKRSNEFEENILNPSEKTSIYSVEAPYKEIKLPPKFYFFEFYWLQRCKESRLRLRVNFQEPFELARKNLDRDELEYCFNRLCLEGRHYRTALGIFSEEFKVFKNNVDLKNWFLEVIETYNNFVKKLEDDSRDLKLKFSIEMNLNLSTFSKKDWLA